MILNTGKKKGKGSLSTSCASRHEWITDDCSLDFFFFEKANRLRFLGKILAVERAKPYTPKISSNDQSGPAPPSPTLPQVYPPEAQRLSSSMSFFEKGSAGAGLRHEPIALSLGIDYPFPPHLE